MLAFDRNQFPFSQYGLRHVVASPWPCAPGRRNVGVLPSTDRFGLSSLCDEMLYDYKNHRNQENQPTYKGNGIT